MLAAKIPLGLRLGVALKTECELLFNLKFVSKVKGEKFDIARIRCTFARRVFASLSDSILEFRVTPCQSSCIFVGKDAQNPSFTLLLLLRKIFLHP